MAKRRGKAISFDAMVKFFMQHYDIPTKKDFEKLTAKMDHLEKLIKATRTSGKRPRVSSGRTAGRGTARSKSGATAYDRVLDVRVEFKKQQSAQHCNWGDCWEKSSLPKKLQNRMDTWERRSIQTIKIWRQALAFPDMSCEE
jgi:hypothetical protein